MSGTVPDSSTRTFGTDPADFEPGGVYAPLKIYAYGCDNCTQRRPCNKHRQIMERDYTEQAAAASARRLAAGDENVVAAAEEIAATAAVSLVSAAP